MMSGPRTARLRIEFQSYWLTGTGTARGRDVDAVAYRDRDGLPAMPMTQVKGQLRETAERLAASKCGGWDDTRVMEMFGSRPQQAEPQEKTTQGALGFLGEARLPEAVRSGLKSSRAALFRRIAATKINELGVAEDKTLRAIEVCVPLALEADIAWIGSSPPAPHWVALLEAACAATLAFGKLKADGYGRAVASFGALS